MRREIGQILKKEEVYKIQYGNSDNPHKILGRHFVPGGQVISAYHPSAAHMRILLEHGRSIDMERAEKTQVFAAFLPETEEIPYWIEMFFPDGGHFAGEDPYRFAGAVTDYDLYRFGKGEHDTIYNKLGAHPDVADGVYGTRFAVWAPGAVRVSVVGNFNCWDGRVHPMRKLGSIGVFELFLPGVGEGEIYKYEIKTENGNIFLKADPYGNGSELRPGNASVVTDIRKFVWSDEKYMRKRGRTDFYKKPMAVYEVHLPSWRRKGHRGDEMLGYRELAHELCDYVKETGYTHVELMGVMEHPFDGSWGYQVTGYYAPTSRHGTAADFMYFVDHFHRNGIGVILDWVPGHFSKDAHGLSGFDGTCLYEHPDPMRGQQPQWDTLVFHYERPEVKNFLIANALFWLKQCHVDGLRVDAVSSMLYLDYGRAEGQWAKNQYGGRENLEAVQFLRELTETVHKKAKGTFLIAEEATAWPGVSQPPETMGLGFDFKWNMGWMHDFLKYMKTYPQDRKDQHKNLTFSLSYAYDEHFVQALSHDEVVHLKKSMIGKMPGINEYEQFSNLKAAYGYQFTHPGKKLLFMGQDFGQWAEWNESRSLDWYLINEKMHQGLWQYVKKLLEIYKGHKSCYELDYDRQGFEWINSADAGQSQISFLRKGSSGKKNLLVVCNFAALARENFRVGVPNGGKYKLILNSDDAAFGGSGYFKTKKNQMAKNIGRDGREYSIEMTLPPLSVLIFEYQQ